MCSGAGQRENMFRAQSLFKILHEDLSYLKSAQILPADQGKWIPEKPVYGILSSF
jgi:hypothetical protein